MSSSSDRSTGFSSDAIEINDTDSVWFFEDCDEIDIVECDNDTISIEHSDAASASNEFDNLADFDENIIDDCSFGNSEFYLEGHNTGKNVLEQNNRKNFDICLSPGGQTEYWTPKVPEDLKLFEGKTFETLADGIAMYARYAEKSGFDFKRGGEKKEDNVILYKYLQCSCAGLAEKSQVNTLEKKPKKSSTSQKTGCQVFISFKFFEEPAHYEIYKFEETHNHQLYTDDTINQLRSKRKLSYFHKSFINNGSSCNIGPTKAHSLYSSLRGGYEEIYPKTTDFSNFQRDLNVVLGESDAHLVVKRMESRKENVDNFSFEYMSDKGKLTGLFWADEIAKINYKEFGDIISFDATFNTNVYKMVFIPFTAIDNHRKNVTVGAGLLANETAESYTWILQCFLRAFEKQPRVVVTDQDAAIKKAVATVFTQSRHRLCMWHVAKLISGNVPKNIWMSTDFRKRIIQIIWEKKLDANLFETRWNSLLDEFHLQGHKWLTMLFNKRQYWIPSYFKDVPLSGIMRTSSRSKSQNSFFSKFFHHKSRLIVFMTKFDAAMENKGIFNGKMI